MISKNRAAALRAAMAIGVASMPPEPTYYNHAPPETPPHRARQAKRKARKAGKGKRP